MSPTSPNQNGGYPNYTVSDLGSRRPVNQAAPARPAAHLLRPGHRRSPTGLRDRRQAAAATREYDTNTETKNYTYTGNGGVPIGNWLNRASFAAKFAERNFLFSRAIGPESQDPLQPRPARAGEGGGAVADRPTPTCTRRS